MTTAKLARGRIARRAALTLALWLGFWILALGLVLGLMWIPFAQSSYRSTLEFSGIVAGLAGLTLAYSLRPRRAERGKASAVTPLARAGAPALYEMVERIGRELGSATPVQIHLISAASAFISGQRNWHGKIKTLEVGLGLPLLGTLSEEELGSVIAHEFGHFAAGDLALGPWVYRTRMSIGHTVAELDDSIFFLDILFRYYGKWFLRLSASVSREQEFAADALAAREFGPRATCDALKKVHLIDPMWSSYFEHELGPALNRGARLPVFEGFRRFCQAGVKRPEVQASIARAEGRRRSEFDTHPSLEERLDALVAGAKPSYPALSTCWRLLGGEQATEDNWYAVLSDATLVRCDWERFGVDIVQAQIGKRFAGSWMDPAQLALGELVPMAEQSQELWERLKPEGISFLSPEGKRNHVHAILSEWLIACLAERGFNAKVRPGLAMAMERAGQVVEPATLLQSALSGNLTRASLVQFEVVEATPA